LQDGVDMVGKLSKAKKMILNANKCEILFSLERQPESILDTEPAAKWLSFNKTPKFLGIYLDRTLSFSWHVDEVT